MNETEIELQKHLNKLSSKQRLLLTELKRDEEKYIGRNILKYRTYNTFDVLNLIRKYIGIIEEE